MCGVIVLISVGTWAPNQPGIWAPTLISIPDVVRNVVFYVPFGALGVLSRVRAGGASAGQARARPWWRDVLEMSLIAVLFSGVNEALQLYTIDRVGSLTDIVSAAIGASAGAIAVSAWRSPE
jgi:VanZ family protein